MSNPNAHNIRAQQEINLNNQQKIQENLELLQNQINVLRNQANQNLQPSSLAGNSVNQIAMALVGENNDNHGTENLSDTTLTDLTSSSDQMTFNLQLAQTLQNYFNKINREIAELQHESIDIMQTQLRIGISADI